LYNEAQTLMYCIKNYFVNDIDILKDKC